MGLKHFFEAPQNFDLVISDITMPDMTGIQLAKKILSVKPGFPIILQSGFGSEVQKSKNQGLDIKEVLIKPVTTAEMSQAVRRVLNDARRSINQPE